MGWALRTTLLVSLIALPPALYIAIRLRRSVREIAPSRLRTATIALWILFALMYAFPVSAVVYHLVIGRPGLLTIVQGQSWLEYLLTAPVWLGAIIAGEIVSWVLLLDILSLAARRWAVRKKVFDLGFAWARLAVAVLVSIHVPARAVIDTLTVRDENFPVFVRGLPDAFDGLQITLIGDVQFDRHTGAGKANQAAGIVQRRQPDLILSAGDIVTSGKSHLGPAEEFLCRLRTSHPRFAVMGDHDLWSAPEEIRRMHRKCGWVFLENEHRTLSVRDRTILVTGVTHVYAERMDPASLGAFLDQAPDADLKLLLVHQPAEVLVAAAAEHGYHIVAAGHTHGGQIVVHPAGIPLTASRFETEFFSGVYRRGETAIVVTHGVGLTLAPLRYHAPAEVTTITLRSAAHNR